MAAVVLAVLSSAARANAADPELTGAMWGITTTEVLLPIDVVVLTAMPGYRSNATGGQQALAIGVSMVMIAGPASIGLVAQANEWDTTVPRAVHLGLWTGLDFLIVGAAIRASHDEPALIPADPVPWIFGGTGFALGAVYGATQVKGGTPREEGLLWTGAMVFVAGALPALVDVAIHGAFDDNETLTRRARRDLAIGGTIGLAAGYTTMFLLPNKLTASATPVSGGAMLACSGYL